MLVDIHSHILPHLDDGAYDKEEAILLATNAAENGITHVIATPHHLNGIYINDPGDIQYHVHKLNSELTMHDIPVKILPGMEIHLDGNLTSNLFKNVLSLAGSNKYLLIELPYNHVPNYTEDIFYELQLKGFIPIIAHAERNSEIRRHPNILFNLVMKGALAQVTASSVLGVHGPELQKFIMKLCKYHLVHFIASDAHHHIKRPFMLQAAYEYIKKNMTYNLMDYFRENSIHVVNGTDFIPPEPIRFEKKNLFGFNSFFLFINRRGNIGK